MNDSSAKRRAAPSADKPNGDTHVSNQVTELILSSQRKNIKGLMRASEVALDGAVAVWRRQLDFAENAARRYLNLVNGLDQSRGSSSEQLATCVEFFRHDFETNLLNARALLELSTKASRESMQVINERLDTSLGEMLRMNDKSDA